MRVVLLHVASREEERPPMVVVVVDVVVGGGGGKREDGTPPEVLESSKAEGGLGGEGIAGAGGDPTNAGVASFAFAESFFAVEGGGGDDCGSGGKKKEREGREQEEEEEEEEEDDDGGGTSCVSCVGSLVVPPVCFPSFGVVSGANGFPSDAVRFSSGEPHKKA